MPYLQMLSIAKTTFYVVSVVGEWNTSMENLWNNTDRTRKYLDTKCVPLPLCTPHIPQWL